MNDETLKSDPATPSGEQAESEVLDKTEALYDRYSERVREFFEASQERSKAALDKAMERAHAQFAAAGEYSVEQGEAFKRFMQRDLAQTAVEMQQLGTEARERLHPARLGAGALASMSRLLGMTGDALLSLSQKAENVLEYHTGDITTAGTLTCMQCEQKLHFKHTTKIPPCPSCHASRFRKSY